MSFVYGTNDEIATKGDNGGGSPSETVYSPGEGFEAASDEEPEVLGIVGALEVSRWYASNLEVRPQ